MSATFWFAVAGLFAVAVPSAAIRRNPVALSFSIASADKSPEWCGHQLVAGQLLHDELVERLVSIESANHVIAIAEGLGPGNVLLVKALRVCVARHVEPVASPTLAVVRRGQQAIDEPFVGVGRLVGQKRVDSSGFGRQPQQIERQAADQRPLVRIGREGELFRFERGAEQRVDRRADAIGRRERGHRRTMDWSEAPERTIVARDLGGRVQLGRLLLGRDRSAPDPALDDGDLGRGQFLIAGGHFARLDPVEQVTLIGMAGRNGWSRFASLGHQPAQPQIEAALADVLAAVTVETVGAEDWADVPLEGGGCGRFLLASPGSRPSEDGSQHRQRSQPSGPKCCKTSRKRATVRNPSPWHTSKFVHISIIELSG